MTTSAAGAVGALASLPDFTKINDSVYFYKGGGDTSQQPGQTSTSRPDLILVLGWGGAPLRNVAKYTTPYRDMFPGVSVLLVLTEFSHIILHTPTSQDQNLEPVIRLINEYLPDRDGRRPRLLLHLFSNGGSYKLIEIAKRYKRATGTRMPIDTLFVDSAPGLPAIGRSVTALSYALPKPWFVRLPGKVLIWFGLVVLKVINAILGREHLMMAMRRRLNDKDIMDEDAKRCYIYSPQDELVGVSDVQDHASDARGKGFDVQEEIFVGSQHVAHAKHDPVRYWKIVKNQWARMASKKETV